MSGHEVDESVGAAGLENPTSVDAGVPQLQMRAGGWRRAGDLRAALFNVASRGYRCVRILEATEVEAGSCGITFQPFSAVAEADLGKSQKGKSCGA